MTLERFLEIINNKEYEKMEYFEGNGMTIDPCIKIHTKNGAYIRFYCGWGFKKLRLFKSEIIDYCQIIFFVPGKDKAVASFEINEDDDRFKMYKDLFGNLVEEIKREQAEKYF